MEWINDISKQEFDLVRCKYDPVFFITRYCYSIDNEDSQVKLIPKYKYIKSLINDIHKEQDNLIEKSRRMLVSWITQAYNIWGLTFGNGYLGLNLSRKEDLVDDRTPDSLFGKMRFIFDRLPAWMIESQFGKYANSDYYIKYLRARNELRNNFVKGESTNTDAGRGGGYSKIFADEYGFVQRSETIYAAFSSACKDGKNLITTPPWVGKKCCFYRLRQDSLKNENDFKIIRIHWSQHPERNQTWYEKECKDKTPDEIARELDIDWNVSIKGRILDRWNIENHIIKYDYQKDLPLDLDFDFGIGESPVSIGFSQDLNNGETVYFKDVEYFKMSVDEIMPKLERILKDEIGYKENLRFLRCWGDPSGKAKGATGKSWISEFKRYGIFIEYTTSSRQRDLEFGHLLLQRMIVKNQLLCTSDCFLTIDSIENYKRKTDSEGNVLDSMIVSDDWAKHRIDGIRYKAINTRAKFEARKFAK